MWGVGGWGVLASCKHLELRKKCIELHVIFINRLPDRYFPKVDIGAPDILACFQSWWARIKVVVQVVLAAHVYFLEQ